MSVTKKAAAAKPAKKTAAKAAAKGSTSATNTGENNNPAGETSKSSLLEEFFTDQLKDIYYAELQIIKALPKMEAACTTDELKEAFNDHEHQSKKQVKRLEKVFGLMGLPAEGEKCEAIEGIIRECESIIDDTPEGSMTRDAALIMAAQKVEHYEIATYGGLVQLAITIGKKKWPTCSTKHWKKKKQPIFCLPILPKAISIWKRKKKKPIVPGKIDPRFCHHCPQYYFAGNFFVLQYCKTPALITQCTESNGIPGLLMRCRAMLPFGFCRTLHGIQRSSFNR